VHAILHTDGGARGNPGPAGIGIVLRDRAGSNIAELARGIGVATNNVAEYTALIAGLELARAHGVSSIDVFVDSELVVAQLAGRWKIRNDRLRTLAAKAGALLGHFHPATITHVPREDNARADALANQAMDADEGLDAGDAHQGSLLE
jgi:ribonuclease H / adenosylcobalamin/alpha-ribazole phosphatase